MQGGYVNGGNKAIALDALSEGYLGLELMVVGVSVLVGVVVWDTHLSRAASRRGISAGLASEIPFTVSAYPTHFYQM